MNPNKHLSHILAIAAWLLPGLVLLFWIGTEDRNLTPVVIVAALVCAAAGLSRFARLKGEPQPAIDRTGHARFACYGGICGAAVGPVAGALILVRTGLHSHGVPVFDLPDVMQVLKLSPAWALAGGMIGLALGLLVLEGGSDARR